MSAQEVYEMLIEGICEHSSRKCREAIEIFDLEATISPEAINSQEYPDSYFQLFIKIIQNEKINNSPYLDDVLALLPSSKEKLSSNQTDQILDVIIKSLSSISDHQSRYAAMDTIARLYRKNDFLSVLKKIKYLNPDIELSEFGPMLNVAIVGGLISKVKAEQFLKD